MTADENARTAAVLAFTHATERAKANRGLLDPALKLPADQRKHTPQGQAAVQAGAHHRASIERAIRAADQLTVALRDLTRADQFGRLGAGLVDVSVAAGEVYDAIEAMEQRLFPLAAATLLVVPVDPAAPVEYWPTDSNTESAPEQ